MSRSSPETERVRHQVASAIDSLTVAALADVFNPRTSSLSKSYSEQIVDILMPRLSGLAPDQSLSALVKQYAIDLRRNASGGDDYPYEYAKATADYLEELIKRAKGNCTCAQAGFPDSCDNCDGLAPTPANTASLDALYECVRDASTENGEMSDFISTDEMIAISEAVLQKFHVIPRVSDTSTNCEGKDHV